MTNQEALKTYLAEPTDENLKRVHAWIRSAPQFATDIDPAGSTRLWRQTQDHAGLVDHLKSQMPALMLNPQTHLMMATALRALGEEKRAQAQINLAKVGVHTVMNSGRGTQEQPWKVLRVADEYGVLQFLNKKSQGVATRDGVDKHQLDDGSAVSFKVMEVGDE